MDRRGAGLLPARLQPRQGLNRYYPVELAKPVEVGSPDRIATQHVWRIRKEKHHMAESITWRDNWTEALAEAKKANRPLALEFHLDG